MPSIDTIRTKLNEVFAQEPVFSAILFGSYARGGATENSDIDIVIDSRGQLIGLGFYRVLEKVTTALGVDVDMFEICQLRAGSPIMDSIQKEGVVIYEREVA